jgi:pilus assembly protein CpaB
MALRRNIGTFVIALIAAAAATFGIHGALETPTAQNRIPTRPVVISVQDIPQGQTIESASVAIARWPIGTVPAGAYTAVGSVVGRIARAGIYKGEVIVPRRLVPDSTADVRR